MPVREAIRRLEKAGLAERVPNKETARGGLALTSSNARAVPAPT
jgi:DNA-binding MarR family transcriptional regulator